MKTMRMLMMLVLAFAAAACATPLGSGGGSVVLVNQSGNAVLYLAMAADEAALVDPNPEWRIEEHLERLLEPGESREVQPSGYSPGEGVVVLVYDVPGAQRTGTVRLSRTIILTGRQISQSRGRVVIPPRPDAP